MNILELLNDDKLKIIITDTLETIRNIENINNNNIIYFILINDHTNVTDNSNIFKINYDINIKYPSLPISGCNEIINNYTDYVLDYLKNNKIDNYLIIVKKIIKIFKKIILQTNTNLHLNIDQYLNDTIPLHLLYKYNNIQYLFNKHGNIRVIPFEYLYINDMYIQRSHNFEYNYKYNKMLTAEKEFWCSLYNENIDNIFLNFDKKRIINIINDDDNIYVILNHPHGWYNFGEFLDAFQKLYIVDKLNLDKNKI